MLKRSFILRMEPDDKNDSAMRGYAFKYNEVADGYYGKERFSEDLEVIEDKRVFMLRDHDPSKMLGRSGVNLEIKTDDQGLMFDLKNLPDTELAKETRELIKKGILDGASVGFMPEKERDENGMKVFESIKLYEISIVGRPYYDSSEVESRHNKINSKIKPPVFY